MAETTRGYPIFAGGMSPAGPVQMQQLAEAIDADVTTTKAELTTAYKDADVVVNNRVSTLTDVTRVAIGATVPTAYAARGSGWQAPTLIREGKRRSLVGSFTNITNTAFAANFEYAIFTLTVTTDRPATSQIFPIYTTAGLGYLGVYSTGAVQFAVPVAVSPAAGAWAFAMDGVFWYVA